jgi:hypothetical protein
VETFQLVISTDGQHSFAAFVYSNPLAIFSSLTDGDSTVGFDSGQGKFADVGRIHLMSHQPLEAVNVFRIDGNSRYFRITESHLVDPDRLVS